MTRRAIFFAYGGLGYLTFLGTLVYAAGFVAAPAALDRSATGTPWTAVAVNLVLLALFAVRHGVTTRP